MEGAVIIGTFIMVLTVYYCAQPEEDAVLYDEVTEDQYRKVVSGRLGKDDFIEDDGVGGYNDNGMDDWGQADVVSDDEIQKKRELYVASAI